jgi:cytochrome c peroxidase
MKRVSVALRKSFPIQYHILIGVVLHFTILVLNFSLGIAEPLGPLPVMKPPSAEVAELGKMLFFDPRLSGDGSISCATCHIPEKGWADGLPLSKAYPGSEGFRNTKTVLNAVYAKYFYWDGRLSGSDHQTQVRDAITESYSMNMDGRLMLERLKQIPEYVERFNAALGGEPSFGRSLKAIAAFEKTLISKNVPFDQGKLSSDARKGLELFQGKAGCIRCHNGPYFSDSKPHNLGVPENPAIFNEPLRHITYRSFLKFLGVSNYMNLRRDVGFLCVSKEEGDFGKFVTPTLREVSRTAPYMHNGHFNTLDDVIEFYNGGGGSDPNKDPLLKPLGLSDKEKKDLVSFLLSLSGDEIIVEPPALPEYELIENWNEVRN